MTTYHATSFGSVTDCNHGEGWITFQWPDPFFGSEGLKIDLDGHCSRNMPIRSGDGPPDFVTLQRDFVRIRFTPSLARQLQLDEEIEIRFSIGDLDYAELRKVVDYFNDDETAEQDAAPDRDGE
jgi:hypothetical protein